MKLSGLWPISIAAIVSVGLFAKEEAYAGENYQITNCTLETLSGQYPVAANGMLIPPVPLFGVPAGAPSSVTAAAGYSIYNGDGTGTDYVTFIVNGVNANVASPTPTKYTINPDCTGAKCPHFNIFVAYDGSVVTAVATDPGFAVSESDRRVRPSQSSQ